VKFDRSSTLPRRAGVRPSLEQPALYQRVNVEGTVNLLESHAQECVKKIISRVVVVRLWRECEVPFSEGDPIFSAISPRGEQAEGAKRSATFIITSTKWMWRCCVSSRLWPAPAS